MVTVVSLLIEALRYAHIPTLNMARHHNPMMDSDKKLSEMFLRSMGSTAKHRANVLMTTATGKISERTSRTCPCSSRSFLSMSTIICV